MKSIVNYINHETKIEQNIHDIFFLRNGTNDSRNSWIGTEWALLILQPFQHFTYVTVHSPTLPSLYLRHSSFSNPSVASPTSQLILQPFFRFSYVTWRAVHGIYKFLETYCSRKYLVSFVTEILGRDSNGKTESIWLGKGSKTGQSL